MCLPRTCAAGPDGGPDGGPDVAIPATVLEHARLCVSRLQRLGETIGTALRLEVTQGGTSDMVVTALHCVQEGGACLDNLVCVVRFVSRVVGLA